MSRRPGIGADCVEEIEKFLTTEQGCNELLAVGDVPMSLCHGKKRMPLGRYLRRKLRERMGFKETGAQEGWEKTQIEEAEVLRAMLVQKNPQARFMDLGRLVALASKQPLANMAAKIKIWEKETL